MTPAQIKDRLANVYSDSEIEVVDLTGTHDHYQVMVVSSAFQDMSRLQRQRSVMDAFEAELKSGEVHALTIKAVAKGEGTERSPV